MIESENYVTDAQLEATYASLGLIVRPEDGPSGAFMAQHHRGLRAVADLVASKAMSPQPVATVHPGTHNLVELAENLERAGYIVAISPYRVSVSQQSQPTQETPYEDPPRQDTPPGFEG